MRRRLAQRVDAFGTLGQAAVGLLKAESAALQAELERNARRLLGVVLLFVVALFAIFWALGAAVFSLIDAAALWLPRWAAALAVTGLLILIAAILALVARRRLRRLETPAATVRRRADEYQEWWRRRPGKSVAFGVTAGERGDGADGGSGAGAGRAATDPPDA